MNLLIYLLNVTCNFKLQLRVINSWQVNNYFSKHAMISEIQEVCNPRYTKIIAGKFEYLKRIKIALKLQSK